ncbi:hypothetical protein NQZ68_038910, partial [Dissostichus eleginoides]
MADEVRTQFNDSEPATDWEGNTEARSGPSAPPGRISSDPRAYRDLTTYLLDYRLDREQQT